MSAEAIVPECARRLLSVVDESEPRLRAFSATESRARQRPTGWSRREVIGHLIDSATINNDRFVRAQVQNDLVFRGYDQDHWVASQRYHEVEWETLVTLLAMHNRQLARVMAAVPNEMRTRVQTRHNFDQVAFTVVPLSEPTTLGYIMDDYVVHMQHHLKAVFGPGWNVAG